MMNVLHKIFHEGPPSIWGRYEKHVNESINMMNVVSFKRSRYFWYPDNDGVPSIAFKILGEKEAVEWIFRDESDREAKYQELLAISFVGQTSVLEGAKDRANN